MVGYLKCTVGPREDSAGFTYALYRVSIKSHFFAAGYKRGFPEDSDGVANAHTTMRHWPAGLRTE